MTDSSTPGAHTEPLMTPAQHRAWAKILRENPGLDPEALDLADAHDQVARAIELWQSKDELRAQR